MRIAALALALFACGGSPPPVKKPKPVPEVKNDSKALMSEARELAKSGDIDAADKSYADAYAATKDMAVLEERVAFLLKNGRAQAAQDAAKAYYDANVSDPRGYQLYGGALLAGGRGAEALEVADTLIQLKTDDPIGHSQKGEALILLDRADEGLDELRKAKDLDPKNPNLHIALGKALDDVKKVDEAALEFQAAARFAPDNAEVYVLLGRARREQGEYGDAKTYLDKALDLDRNSGRAYFELGLLYDKQNKESDAEVALAQAVQKSPSESIFWYAYGEIFRGQDRMDEALKAYKTAVGLENPFPKAIQKYVGILIEKKQYDEAEDLLTKAIRKDGRNAQNYLYAGQLYQAKKKWKPAVENYQKFLELAPKTDPERNKVKELVNELKRR
jgi:tetratricopeptide (TPR) repeat protein